MRALLAAGSGIVVLLLLLPVASAAVEGLSWSSSAPVDLDGALDVSAPGGVAEMEDAHARGAHVLELGNGTITISSWDLAHAPAPAEYGTYQAPLGSAQDQDFPVRATRLVLTLDDEPLRLTLVAQPGGALDVEGANDTQGRPVQLARDVAGYPAGPLNLSRVTPYRPPPFVDWTWSAGWLFLGDYPQASPDGFPTLSAPTLRASGPASLMALGGTASFLDGQGVLRTVRLGVSPSPGSPSPVVAPIQRETRLLFHGEIRDASIHPSGHWGLAGPDVTWRLRGTLVAQHATGEYRDETGAHAFRDAPLQASGELALAPLRRPDALAPSSYAASGGFDALAVGDARVGTTAPRAPLGAPAVEATVLGVALLAIVRVLAAFYTRLAPSDLLAHAARRRLHEVVSAEPGIHLREAGRRTGLSWSALRFHVAMMERGGLLRLDRRSGRTLIHLAGAGPVPAAPIVHPVAHRILASIPEGGAPIGVRELREKVGVSRQLLSYHLDRLAAEGRVLRIGTRPALVARAP